MVHEAYKNHIELALSRAGFYIEEKPDDPSLKDDVIAIWPRGKDESEGAFYLIAPPGSSYTIQKATGYLNRKVFKEMLQSQIKGWNFEYVAQYGVPPNTEPV